jgi:hypothetical protein
LIVVIMCEMKSVTNIKYILDTYNQNTINDTSLNTLKDLIPTLRTAEAFNYILVLSMFIGFGVTYYSMGKDIRRSMC